MTWTISMTGHDDLSGEYKEAFEKDLVEAARDLVNTFKNREGGRVTTAMCTTNTTGSVNLLAEEV